MNFPLGSLATLLCLILVAFGFLNLEQNKQRVVALGLFSVLLGEFLVIPLPSPKGIQVNLNVGQTLVPVLIAVMLWFEASVEDKYHTSLGTLAIGLTLYGIAALLDLEPGLINYPLLVAVPVITAIAVLTGRTVWASTMAIISGCILVTVIRYFEMIFSLQPGSLLDIPGSLIWNTMSMSAFISCSIIWGWDRLKEFVNRENFDASQAQELPQQSVSELECEPVSKANDTAQN